MVYLWFGVIGKGYVMYVVFVVYLSCLEFFVFFIFGVFGYVEVKFGIEGN